MSKAEDLLNSLSDEEIMLYSTAVGEEGHIIIGADRTVTVPDELKKIAVQYDHNVETVTFDCPRYSDGVDMSEMAIYVNYMRPDGYKDAYPCKNIVVDETDPETMHFDWTITRNVTQVSGNLRFLVCVKKTDVEGNDVNHWNSDLCSDVRVGEGLECEEQIEQENPDTITAILTRLDTIEQNPFDFIVTLSTTDGTNFTSNKTYAEIAEAHEAGRNVWFYCEAMGKAKVPVLMYDGMVSTSLMKNDTDTNTQTLVTVTLFTDDTIVVNMIPMANKSEEASWNNLKDKPFYLEKTLFLQLTKDDFDVDEDGYLLYASTPKLDWLVSSDNVGLYISVVKNDGNSYVSTENSPDYYFEKGQNNDGTEYVILEGDRYYITSGFDDRFSIEIYTNYEDTKEINFKLYRVDVKKIPGICVDAPIGKTALTIEGELYDEATDDNIPVIIPQIEIPIESSYVSGSYIFYDTEHRVLRTSEEFMPWNGEHQIRRPNLSPPPLGGTVSVTIAKGDAEWNQFGCDNWKTNKYMSLMFIFNNGTKYLEFFVCIRDGSNRTALCSNASGNIYLLTLNYVDDYTKIIMNIKCILK